MNTYHVNLTDEAVLRKLELAKKALEKKVQFNVPQASKSFLISLDETDFDEKTVFEKDGVKFVIFEVNFIRLIKELNPQLSIR
jgi:hypothetical protein